MRHGMVSELSDWISNPPGHERRPDGSDGADDVGACWPENIWRALRIACPIGDDVRVIELDGRQDDKIAEGKPKWLVTNLLQWA
jgi:hypothetical protein